MLISKICGKALPVDEHPIRESGVVVGGPQVAQPGIQGAHRWTLYQQKSQNEVQA
jgi:hypothetical protein